MKLLNLCCGNVRPQSTEWTNVDNLHATLLPGTPERKNLDAEKNYINFDVEEGLPFKDEEFDGLIGSHCFEHWDCQTAVEIMMDCRDVLKPGGILMVSVPDASYFRKVHDRDSIENAIELFGEPIHEPDGEKTFLGYGLFNRYHKTVLTEDALWSYFVRAGFDCLTIARITDPIHILGSTEESPMKEMSRLLNRLPFSLVMTGRKT